MKFLIGDRASGKTTELIKISAKENAVIVCLSYHMVQYVKKYAKSLSLNIPEPIVYSQMNVFEEGTPNKPKYLFDDFESYLKTFFKGADILMVSATGTLFDKAKEE